MSKRHPDDQQLQKYLNKTCSEHEYRRIHHHLQSCPGCKSQLYGYMELESLLDRLPVLAAPSGLEESIMESIRESGTGERPQPSAKASYAARFRLELVHGFIAAAATFLFISSGMWTRMMSINPVQWSEDVQSKVSVIEVVVQRISAQLLS